MFKLKLSGLFCIVLILFLAPSCKQKKSKVVETKEVSAQAPQKSVSVFDNDLEAFVIDEDEAAFGPQEGFALVDESESDLMVEQSRHGFMPIYFEFDADCMKPAQMGALENNLARAKKLVAQGKKIVIEGHACKFAGSPEYNMHLSEQRAQCVHKYFVKNGIPAAKVTVVGRGSESCLVGSGNKEQQSPNRRVEFVSIDIERPMAAPAA
jgi:outer membrane protein OmpA-like peptidoglycan-associated protein